MKQTLFALLVASFSNLYAQADQVSTAEGNPSPPRTRPAYRPGFALMASVGSAGGGLAVGYSINRRLAARLGANAFTYSGTLKSGKESDDLQIGFDYKIKLKTINALVDYYPFAQTGVRLTGGVFYNLNQIDFFGKPTKDVKMNDVTFTVDQVGTLSGQAAFNRVAPYVGLGFGNPYTRRRLKFMVDLGFFYQQSPQITFKSTGLLEPSSDQGAVIENNLKPLKFYPIVNFGLSYKL